MASKPVILASKIIKIYEIVEGILTRYKDLDVICLENLGIGVTHLKFLEEVSLN